MADDNGNVPKADREGPRTKSNIPAELRELPRWIRWATGHTPGGKPTKKPQGSTLQHTDWGTFDDVFAELPQSDDEGAGFVFTGCVPHPDGGWVLGFDLDACVTRSGDSTAWAREVLDAYPGTFYERSPSGTGLHLFVRVAKLPGPVSLIKVPEPAPEGVNKRPAIQVFGTGPGPAGYMTVTGRVRGEPLPLPLFPDISWLLRRYHAGDFAPTEANLELPKGTGIVPTFDAIDKALQRDPDMVRLLAGDWQGLGLDSASEGWWRLSRAALRAAHNHGGTAAAFLIARTAYGVGLVDSRDPARYARQDWVERDLSRIGAKTQDVGADAFDDGFDSSTWNPPAPPPGATAAWVLPFGEFRARRQARRWLFKGLLPARGLAQFFGDPSSGKTPFAVSAAVHVAAGLDWLGFPLKRPGSVVYMVGEDESGIIDRVTAQLGQTDPLIDPEKLPLFVTTRPGQLSDPENRQRWEREIAAVLARNPWAPELSLLVIDTQNRNFGPGDENDTKEMGIFVDQLDKLGRAIGCLILLVHHTGHAAKDRARGSMVLYAALDACMMVTRKERTLTLTTKKAKNWAEPEPIYAGLVPVVIGVDEDGDDVTAVTLGDRPPEPGDVFEATAEDAEEQRAVMRVVDAVQGRPVSLADLQALGEWSKKQIRTRLQVVQEAGYLTVRTLGNGARNVYVVTATGREFLKRDEIPKQPEDLDDTGDT